MVAQSKFATKEKAFNVRRARYIEPIIPLERPSKKVLNKDEIITYKSFLSGQ